MRHRLMPLLAGLAFLASLCTAPLAHAQSPPDKLGLAVVSSGHGKVRLTVTAGPSGAPNGFEVWWMTTTEFASYGNTWPPPWVPGEGWVDYVGIGTLNTFGAPQVDFHLAPNQSVDVEIGDTFDETGVSGTTAQELVGGTDYVFCAYAYGATAGTGSPLSVTLDKPTTPQGGNCTFTQGYWKNHTSVWPVSALTLGTVSYTAAQLEQILLTAVTGNGLVALAHQLIAAKLNIANGADPTAVNSAIASADALIGGLVVPPIGSGTLSPSATSALTQTLDDYNNGLIGPGHCGTTPARTSTWGRVKSLYH